MSSSLFLSHSSELGYCCRNHCHFSNASFLKYPFISPQGAEAPGSGTIASGPVSFMRIWDSTCATLLSTGARRGAMMGTLRCDHPDIETFVDAKRERSELRHFNVSVLVSDAFMAAVRSDDDWPLVFPAGEPSRFRAPLVPRQ